MNKCEQILPGSWLGVLGGGQLGRMFTQAAQKLGYHVAVYESSLDCPAGQVADRVFQSGGEKGEQELQEMAQLCSVITLEFENVSADLVRQAGRFTLTHPNADFLEICQDRVREKGSLVSAGYPTTPFEAVTNSQDVLQAGRRLGWPLVLKTAQSGYDGKGQVIVRSEDQLAAALENLGDSELVAEKWIEFDSEVSMITARNLQGEMVSYPLLENDHADHILDVSRCPVSSHLKAYETQAREICQGIAENFGVIGLFCVEFFAAKTGELMINEMAPRPHNSGHLTMDAFTCGQFEQQVRAICNLPLVSSKMIQPAAMVNLLGDVWQNESPNWNAVLACPQSKLHLYGKAEPRPGRKMGHITVLDGSSSEAAITARELRDVARGS